MRTGSRGFNYVNQPMRKLNEGTWDIRLDHNFSSKDSAFARFSYDQATNFVPGGSPTWSEANAFGSNQHIENHGRNVVVTETHVFSPNLINQATVGYNRIFNHILSYGTGTCEAALLGIPGADLASSCDSITGYPASLNQSPQECESCGMTSFQMSAYFSVGDRGYAPYQGGTNVYSLSDTLDWIHGKHEIRVGLVFRAEEMNVRNNAFQDGYVVETGAADWRRYRRFASGQPGRFRGPRSNISGRDHRPPLEAVSSLRAGQLAGHQQFDVEPRIRLGVGDAGNRGSQPAGELRCSEP